MKRILLTSLLFALTWTMKSNAQDFGKNLGSVSVAVENQNPDKYIFSDEQVSIKIKEISIYSITFEATNKTNSSISFNWGESYYVVDGESLSMENGSGQAAVAIGMQSKEVNSQPKDLKIGPKTKVNIISLPKGKTLFNFSSANKYFKEESKVPENKAVLAFNINGSTVEKPITFQIYTGKIKKGLKK
ncbi:exported hypothetical protein [Sphingobacterium sp. PM2-P1-29]|nr:exported hypothetical protein [Sphingobacterium sp. PM2-P1-29]